MSGHEGLVSPASAEPSAQFYAYHPHFVGGSVAFGFVGVVGHSEESVGVAGLFAVAVEEPPGEPVFDHDAPLAVSSEGHFDFEVGCQKGVEEEVGLECEPGSEGFEPCLGGWLQFSSLWECPECVGEALSGVYDAPAVVDGVVGVSQVWHEVFEYVGVVLWPLPLDDSEFFVEVMVEACVVDGGEDFGLVWQVGCHHAVAQSFPVLWLVVHVHHASRYVVGVGYVACEALASPLCQPDVVVVGSLG